MGELTIGTFLSLDGVMQAPGGPEEDKSGGFVYGGWQVPYADEDMGPIITEIFSKVGGFLLGRFTYDIFAAYWPRVADADHPLAAKMNELPKFVASRTRTAFTWSNSHHVADVVAEVPELKRRTEGELQVIGSGDLAQTLMENDLIDEYRLLTYPVVLGSGKRLFGSGAVPRALSLVTSSTTSAGVVYSVYRPAGSVETGSFE